MKGRTNARDRASIEGSVQSSTPAHQTRYVYVLGAQIGRRLTKVGLEKPHCPFLTRSGDIGVCVTFHAESAITASNNILFFVTQNIVERGVRKVVVTNNIPTATTTDGAGADLLRPKQYTRAMIDVGVAR